MDKSSIAGIALALGGILLGLMLEGGKLTQILQPTAAMIVLGGTMGAVMLQFPLKVVFAAFRRLGSVLDDISEVGKGIAVAFVATIYGVGMANIFFLPCAGKIKLRVRQEQIQREMTLEGVISIVEGMNPRMIETKLMGFFAEANRAHVPEREA